MRYRCSVLPGNESSRWNLKLRIFYKGPERSVCIYAILDPIIIFFANVKQSRTQSVWWTSYVHLFLVKSRATDICIIQNALIWSGSIYLLTTRFMMSGSLSLMLRRVGITCSSIWFLSSRTRIFSKKPRMRLIILTSLWFFSSKVFTFTKTTVCKALSSI